VKQKIMTGKKVIIVRGRGIDPAVHKMAQTLADYGYVVQLFVWDRQRTMNIDQISGFAVNRCTFKAPYDNPWVIFYLPLWWLYEIWYLLHSDCHIIHACDIESMVPAVLVKLIKNIRLNYTIYDFYADTLPNRTPRFIRNCIASFEKYLIRFTDTVFLVDEIRYSQIKGAKINKIAYIYNTPPDHDKIGQNPDHAPGLNTFVLFYAGILHKSRGLEYVLRAIMDINPLQLIIAGIGQDLDLIKEYTKRYPEKIRYLGVVSYEEVIDNSLRADVLFGFYDPAIPNNRYASPNKLFESMMCGKPIITNDSTSMAEIVRKEKCGLIVPYGDVDAIRHAIRTLMDDPELCMQLGAHGREAYEQKYTWTIMEKRLITAYENTSN